MDKSLSPKPGEGKLLAVGLLLVVIIVLFTFVLQPLMAAQADLDAQIATTEEQLQAFQKTAAMLGDYKKKLADIKKYQGSTDFFLEQTTFNLAAAELTNRLKKLVSSTVSQADHCQVVSTQNVRAREVEQFEPVTIKARMRCDMVDLAPVLHDLEGLTPLVLLDNVNIYRQEIRKRRGKRARPTYLDVRFDLVGYIRPSAKGAAASP